MNRSTPGLPVQHQTASYKCGILDPIARSSDAVGFVVPVAVQSLSCVWLFMTPWTTACQASLSFIISLSLLKLMPIELMMPSNHLILCHSLLFLPSVFPIIFSSESALCFRWSKYWSFSINPSNDYSELFSFSNDWFDLFAAQGTLKSIF